MNPLIVLEKKYIEKYNFGCAAIIAFLKENGGIYVGSLNKMANEMGVLSSTGVVKAERYLERKNVITSKKNKSGGWQYKLNVDCEGLKPKEEYIEDECEKEIEIQAKTSKKRPLKETLPPSVMKHVVALEEIRKNKAKKFGM